MIYGSNNWNTPLIHQIWLCPTIKFFSNRKEVWKSRNCFFIEGVVETVEAWFVEKNKGLGA